MAGTSTGDDQDGKRQEETSSSRHNNGTTKAETKTRRNPSVVSLAIARAASYPGGVSSMHSKVLAEGLYKGVLLGRDKDRVKFWIDDKLHKNCLMLLANGLSIAWGQDDRYWGFISHEEDCFGGPVDIDVARLKSVCYLHISGSLASAALSPMTNYEVVFELKMNESADGWDMPVNLTLKLPNDTTQGRTENFETKPKGRWLQIPLGEFVTTPKNIGSIEFSLFEHADYWKSGLVVKGVTIRPKY